MIWEIIIGVAVGLVVIAVLTVMIIRKKQGKNSCGCDCGCCSGCPSAKKEKLNNK